MQAGAPACVLFMVLFSRHREGLFQSTGGTFVREEGDHFPSESPGRPQKREVHNHRLKWEIQCKILTFVDHTNNYIQHGTNYLG